MSDETYLGTQYGYPYGPSPVRLNPCDTSAGRTLNKGYRPSCPGWPWHGPSGGSSRIPRPPCCAPPYISPVINSPAIDCHSAINRRPYPGRVTPTRHNDTTSDDIMVRSVCSQLPAQQDPWSIDQGSYALRSQAMPVTYDITRAFRWEGLPAALSLAAKAALSTRNVIASKKAGGTQPFFSRNSYIKCAFSWPRQ